MSQLPVMGLFIRLWILDETPEHVVSDSAQHSAESHLKQHENMMRFKK